MSVAVARVVKVGGSLLDDAELPMNLRRWLDQQVSMSTVLIAGGGEFADELRQLDQRFRLGEQVSHWLCMRAMSITADVLAAMLDDIPLVRTWEQLHTRLSEDAPAMVFDAHDFLTRHECRLPGMRLVHSWSVSSDSISARIAVGLDAFELVLLKSASPPAGWTRETASVADYVDKCFSRMSEPLHRVRCVNLRSPGFAETLLPAQKETGR